MERPAIPAEIRRAVLVEAGHRCAIPRCGGTELDIHHIVPWEICHKHEYSNLIALCLVCHRRVHKQEIDRKSLLQYKAALTTAENAGSHVSFDAPIVEIRRRISENNLSTPGYTFEFDFPDFPQPAQRVVSKNLEAWGNELLAEFRNNQAEYSLLEKQYDQDFEGVLKIPSQLKGTYHVVRNDDVVISLEYALDRYSTGAAHGRLLTYVQNFLINPFQPVTVTELLSDNKSLDDLSALVQEQLLSSGKYHDEDWVIEGTKPTARNFSRFVLGNHEIRFMFDEYQIDCYAAGRQELSIGYDQFLSVGNPSLLATLKTNGY